MLPSARDFECKRLLGDTTEFDNALSATESKINSILQARYDEAAEEQTRLSERIKAVDKQAQLSTNKMTTASKRSYTKLGQQIQMLDEQLSVVSSMVVSIADELYAIDKLLPIPEQLLAPTLPHQAQFPNLTKLMLEKRLLQPVSMQGVVAEAEMDPQLAQAAMLQEDVDYVRAKLRAFQS